MLLGMMPDRDTVRGTRSERCTVQHNDDALQRKLSGYRTVWWLWLWLLYYSTVLYANFPPLPPLPPLGPWRAGGDGGA
jgi:hypothetical protein